MRVTALQVPRPRPQPLRVLIVEDRSLDAELALHTLRKADFEVAADVVSTPGDFFERLRSGSYDLVLADYDLGGWTGIDALAVLQEQGKDIPFILMSGTLGDELAVACMKKGVTDYVLKDRLARLPVAIRQALEGKARREERRKADETLRETTETLQAIFRASPMAIIALDRLGRMRHWNPAAERIFGWSSQEALGRFLPFWPADRLGEARELIDRAAQGEVLTDLETTQNKKDGSPVSVSISAAPLRDAQGNVIGIEALIADITQRKLLEEQLRQSQKMEAIGQLAGGVAHDFNNLLTIIGGYSQLLLELNPSSAQREQIIEVKRAADRAAMLTRQLLAFSRSQALAPQALDLNAVVLNAEKMLKRLIGEDIELITVLGSGLGRVKSDPGQMEQVIMNLALNSRDAMPQGGKLTLQTSDLHLQVRDEPSPVPPGAYVLLSVSDTGCGMDAATQAHIFEPFYTTKDQGKGTGLGLATVFRIVKQSGGYIGVHSAPGYGATFEIYFPRVDEAIAAVESPSASAAVARGSETILLVEDEEPLRRLTRGVLQSRGYTVLEALGGEHALQLSEQYPGPIHLVLTDVVMPGISGPTVAERLAASRPESKVVYVSGHPDDAIVRHGVSDGRVDLLHKPFTPEALARKVREVLDASCKETG